MCIIMVHMETWFPLSYSVFKKDQPLTCSAFNWVFVYIYNTEVKEMSPMDGGADGV
jgi:hypothetical protein